MGQQVTMRFKQQSLVDAHLTQLARPSTNGNGYALTLSTSNPTYGLALMVHSL